MAKRRLSEQQRRRIEQQKRADPTTTGPAEQGLIVAHYGTRVEVQSANSQSYVCFLRQNLPALAVGDKVMFEHGPENTGVVTQYLPRTSLISRHVKNGQEKLLAANVEQAFLVIAAKPTVQRQLIDRYLVNTHHLGIITHIVFNKVDMLSNSELIEIKDKLRIYEKIGYTLIYTSCKDQFGINLLSDMLNEHISIFIGQSGVGKSSLIQLYKPECAVKIGDLSQSERGQHTTTTARVYDLKCGGRLIDSPGIRDLPLAHLSPQEIQSGFIEFAPFIGECRFNDCHHGNEPGCALQNAIRLGLVDAERLNNYHLIVKGAAT